VRACREADEAAEAEEEGGVEERGRQKQIAWGEKKS
jgi:hypothetical protein